ncbi:MAG: hypothetical protein ACQESC_01740 [Nanobdellota archaeon]
MKKIHAIEELIKKDCNELESVLRNINHRLSRRELTKAKKEWEYGQRLVTRLRNLDYQGDEARKLAKKRLYKILEHAKKELHKDFS